MVPAAALVAVPALASTSITVNTGGCAGGGAGYCFAPESASGATGSAVAWTNQSGVAHTITLCTAAACPGAPASTGSDTFDLSLGGIDGSGAQFTFSNAGTYRYYCKLHGYAAMHGAVAVATAPTPTPARMPTPKPSASSVKGASTPATGSALGWPVLLLPLGILLTLLGLAPRRKH